MTSVSLINSFKTIFTALSIFLILLSFNVNAQKPDAAATVQAFYRFHESRSGIFNVGEMKTYRRWFADDLNELFQNELRREKEYLKKNPTNKPYFGDGLPFAPLDECSSGGKFTANTYQVGTAAVEGEKATVEIKFYQPKVCGGELVDAYKIELIKSRGKWLIADWIYSNARTLTADLKRTDY